MALADSGDILHVLIHLWCKWIISYYLINFPNHTLFLYLACYSPGGREWIILLCQTLTTKVLPVSGQSFQQQHSDLVTLWSDRHSQDLWQCCTAYNLYRFHSKAITCSWKPHKYRNQIKCNSNRSRNHGSPYENYYILNYQNLYTLWFILTTHNYIAPAFCNFNISHCVKTVV